MNHPSHSIPHGSDITEGSKQANLLSRTLMVPLSGRYPRFSQSFQNGIAGDSQDIVNTLTVTPSHHFPSAKTTVATDHNPDMRPNRSQAIH